VIDLSGISLFASATGLEMRAQNEVNGQEKYWIDLAAAAKILFPVVAQTAFFEMGLGLDTGLAFDQGGNASCLSRILPIGVCSPPLHNLES
jgi:hypothetical protein